MLDWIECTWRNEDSNWKIRLLTVGEGEDGENGQSCDVHVAVYAAGADCVKSRESDIFYIPRNQYFKTAEGSETRYLIILYKS